ncbi:MAG: acyl-CoA thioesterase [Flavipsychrobacter sp.]
MKTLHHSTELEVKFSEADPLGIVWHGHYIRYFEDAREAFGETYGIKYLDFYRNNIIVPIVSIQCDYKRVLRYGHKIRLETTYKDSLAAKLLFDYAIYDVATEEKIATGSSVQVFMERESLDLMLTIPKFMEDWKKKWLSE